MTTWNAICFVIGTKYRIQKDRDKLLRLIEDRLSEYTTTDGEKERLISAVRQYVIAVESIESTLVHKYSTEHGQT